MIALGFRFGPSYCTHWAAKIIGLQPRPPRGDNTKGQSQASPCYPYHISEPFILKAPQVEIMQIRQINNIVDAVLDSFGIHWLGGEDVSRHEALHLHLSPDPTIGLYKP